MIAASFLTGSLLTLFIPVGLLVAVLATWAVAARRRKAS